MKAKVSFRAVNGRLAEKKDRTITVEIAKELYDNWDIDGMEKAAEKQIMKLEQHDTFVTVKTIKIGRHIFELNR